MQNQFSSDEVHTPVTHRVVSGQSADAIVPNFFDNDWDIFTDGLGTPISMAQFDALLSAGEITYLRSLTGLSAGTYFINLTDQVVQTSPFQPNQVVTGSVTVSTTTDIQIDPCTILRIIAFSTTTFINDNTYQLCGLT